MGESEEGTNGKFIFTCVISKNWCGQMMRVKIVNLFSPVITVRRFSSGSRKRNKCAKLFEREQFGVAWKQDNPGGREEEEGKI